MNQMEVILKIEEIGKFIRYLRKKSKLTQEEFADRAGVARNLVGNFETGNANIQIKNLINFLDVFNFELTIIEKGSTIEGTTDPLAVKVAEQIYNTVSLNFGHTRETKAKFGWVYIFKPVGKIKPIKIGYTQQNKPEDRLAYINTTTPHKYEVYYSVLDSDCRYTEKSMFYNFEKHQLDGEWYDVDCAIAKEKLIEISNSEVK